MAGRKGVRCRWVCYLTPYNVRDPSNPASCSPTLSYTHSSIRSPVPTPHPTRLPRLSPASLLSRPCSARRSTRSTAFFLIALSYQVPSSFASIAAAPLTHSPTPPSLVPLTLRSHHSWTPRSPFSPFFLLLASPSPTRSVSSNISYSTTR